MYGHCVTQGNYQAFTHRYKMGINLFPPLFSSQASLTTRHQLLFLQLPFDVPVRLMPHDLFQQVPLIGSDQLPSEEFQCFLCRRRAHGFQARALALSSHRLQRSAGNDSQQHLVISDMCWSPKSSCICTRRRDTMAATLIQVSQWFRTFSVEPENIMSCYHPVELNCHLTLFQVNYINPTLSLQKFVKDSKQWTSFMCTLNSKTHSRKSPVFIRANGNSRLSDPDTGKTSLTKFYCSSCFYC